ncbi:AraC family transcriptional regulator [Paenibacillus chartarius]|uniref:AraC family transcriptional regulator n=1 Tax=Paenibacillus chartarius TaxID=747481 RepID=A0ABV6DPK7_9BACL
MRTAVHPRLTYFVTKKCTSNWRLDTNRIHFYDMVFVLDGSADYVIDEVPYHVEKGSVIFIKPNSTRSAATAGMLCTAIDFCLHEGETLALPTVSYRADMDDFVWLFKELNFEWLQRKEGCLMKCEALCSLILHKLLFEETGHAANKHIETVKRYIVEHYDEKLTVASLAKIANINPVYCGALFKKMEGRSISDFINRVRINKAASLLETGEYNVGEVGEKTGFSDIYHFSATFKRLLGVTPKSYQTGAVTGRRLL